MATKVDELINDIFTVLPCKSYMEIADKVSALRKVPVKKIHITDAISHLRKHSTTPAYGWTIPHIKRGPATSTTGNRLRAVLFNRRADEFISDEERIDTQEGMVSTLSLIASQAQHQQAALEAAAKYERSKIKREAARELALDVGYVGRKAASMLTMLRDAG
jgi:hypothetical protein